MASRESPQVKRGYMPVTASQANVVLCAVGTIDMSLTEAQAVDNGEFLKLCILPQEHVLLDAYLDTDALDDGAAFVMDAGLLNAAGNDIGATEKFISASTAHRAAARTNMKHPASSILGKRQEVDRIVAVKFSTKPHTAKAGRVTMTILYRAAEYGEVHPS